MTPAAAWKAPGKVVNRLILLMLALGMVRSQPPACDLDVQKSCQVIEDSPQPPGSTCEATVITQCNQKLTALGLQYVGGDVNEEAVSIVLSKQANTMLVNPSDTPINLGEEFSIEGVGGKNIKRKLNIDILRDGSDEILQSVEISTACSNLRLGDQFGALQVRSMVQEDGSELSLQVEVKYTYLITNNGATVVEDIYAVDDKLGVLFDGGGQQLSPSEQKTVTKTANIGITTTNLVFVEGRDEISQCAAQDSATVTVQFKGKSTEELTTKEQSYYEAK